MILGFHFTSYRVNRYMMLSHHMLVFDLLEIRGSLANFQFILRPGHNLEHYIIKVICKLLKLDIAWLHNNQYQAVLCCHMSRKDCPCMNSEEI